MPTNTKTGMVYNVIPAPGGAWHVYADGRKVFVASSGGVAKGAGPTVSQGGGGGGGGPSAEESAYWTGQAQVADGQQAQQAAQSLFEREQGLQANDRSAQTNSENYREALRQMGIAQPREEQGARVGANKQGLYYSSTLGNQLSDIAANYVDKRTAAQKEFSRAEAERVSARQSIEAGYGVTGQGQAENAIGRFITSDTSAADAGALTPTPGPVAPASPVARAPVARMPAATPFKTVVKRHNVYRYRSGQKPQYVRRASR